MTAHEPPAAGRLPTLSLCPLCGKPPADFKARRYDGPKVQKGPVSDFGYMGNRTCWVILCHGCCMTAPHNSEAEAIAAWNDRAQKPEVATGAHDANVVMRASELLDGLAFSLREGTGSAITAKEITLLRRAIGSKP